MDTREHVQLRLMEARNQSRDWHEQIKHWRDLYNLNHYGNRSPQEPQFSDPTYTNTVDLAVGMLMANEFKWRAYGWSPSKKEQEASSRIEKFLSGALTINSEREEYFIIYEVLLNFVRDGAAVLYSVWDGAIAKDSETEITLPDPDSDDLVVIRKAYGDLPLRTQVIDPLKMYFIPGGNNRWLAALRIERMSVLDVEAQYGITIGTTVGRTPVEKSVLMGDFIDYWETATVLDEVTGAPTTVVRNAVLYDNFIIRELRVMEGYDDLPYTVDFFKPVNRDRSNGWGHSILSPLETPVAFLEKAINRRQFQIDVYSSLPLVAKVANGRELQLDPGLGNVVTLSLEEDMAYPQWAGNPPDVAQQIDFMRSRVQQSGFSDVMFGSGSSQVSGYALSQLGDQNRIRLEQPVKHLEQLFTRWAKKALRLVSAFASDAVIRIYGQMKGKDFIDLMLGEDADRFMVKCQIKPEFPNEKVRNHAMATQVRGLLSESTIMENYLGIEQPDDERKKKLVEVLQMHPLVVQYTLVSELTRMANEDNDEIAAKVLQQMESGGIAGMPGRPKEPSNPEQPMGLQSSTGQAPAPQGAPEDLSGLAGAAPNMMGGIM